MLHLTPEIRDALEQGHAVVALESTIISHGMPYPQNLHTARAVEQEVRQHGAVPATVALMDGQLKIGLSPDELERLSTDSNVMKVSRRDLGYALSQRRIGATTVATTMLAARLAGIAVFATGGIGGVHRGVERTLDISADLEELAQTPVAVVCAGAKSILDLPRTLEYLETAGVPVIGYGTEDFPAFYTRSSGLNAAFRLDTPQEVAALMAAHWGLGVGGGIVVANPVPLEAAMNEAEIGAAIHAALEALEQRGIGGKEATPFLLGAIVEATGGRSLETNIALVLNNARVAAQIAVSHAGARAGGSG